LRVGEHVIKDIVASVAPDKADPLLGQSFLGKLPGWTIDNTKHTLVIGVGGEGERPQAASTAPTSPAAVAPAQDINLKDIVGGEGDCRLELVKGAGYGPCKAGFMFMLFKNGRHALIFSLLDDTVVTVAGAGDRQPRLEDYYISIDRLRIKKPGREEVVDPNMEGECHMRITRDTGTFLQIECDVYNRGRGLGLSARVTNIINPTHKHFN